jgi:hypothetical protein
MLISLDLSDFSVPTLEKMYSIIKPIDIDNARAIRQYLDNLDD